MTKNTIYIGLGKLSVNFAAYIYEIGILIYLYEETDSILAVSGLIVSQIIPTLVVMISGNVIDKLNNQVLLYIYNSLKICSLLVLLFCKKIFAIYFVTFVLNLLFEVENSTIQCLVARSCHKDELLKESTIINFFDSMSFFLAPIVSAVIIKIFSVNTNILIASTVCGASIMFYSLINFKIEKNIANKSILDESVAHNSKYFLTEQVFVPTLFWCAFMFFIGMSSPIEIHMIKNILKMPSVYYGIGNGIEGIGMIIATGYLIKSIKNNSPKDIIKLGLLISSISYFIIGISYNIFVYFIGALFVGITSTFCPLGFKTEVQQCCNRETLGREYTRVRMLIMLFRILGILAVGFISDMVNIRYIYFALTVALLITVILFERYNPRHMAKE